MLNDVLHMSERDTFKLILNTIAKGDAAEKKRMIENAMSVFDQLYERAGLGAQKPLTDTKPDPKR